MIEIIAHTFFHTYSVKKIKIYDDKIKFYDTDEKPNFTVIPGFINAHTHLGDSFIKSVPKLDVKELVGPGGFKQKMLNSASKETILNGIKESFNIMKNDNTRSFIDFRENGIEGLKLIKSIKSKNVEGIILSRPSKNILDENELNYLLENSSGIGLSSISDYDFDFIKEIAKITKERNKIFAIHASERIREDMNKILNLNPDFLIHLHKANDDDLDKVKEKNIPVVICPRSGLFFNIEMNMKRFLDKGIPVAIGTDNAMIAIPSIRIEMMISALIFNVSSLDILKASTITMEKFTSPPNRLYIFKNNPEEIIRNPFIKAEKILNLDKKTVDFL